jgi:ABC-type lipoprotein export system ATPase subunit
MTASVPIVRLENVSRDFDDGAVVALCDVSLSTYANDCVAILGKSGSGKSTLIHVLSGCDEVTSGRVYWREEPVRDQRTWRKLRASQIGIVFQEFYLLPTLTAMENVELEALAVIELPVNPTARAADAKVFKIISKRARRSFLLIPSSIISSIRAGLV